MSKKSAGFFLGAIFGAAAGAVAGLFLAPRSGEETRALAADAVNDAWDSALASYERTSKVVSTKIDEVKPTVDAKTDELRAKVDLARERMDQLRESLSDAVTSASNTVADAADVVADSFVVPEPTATTAEAQAVRIENVESQDQQNTGEGYQEA